MESYVCNLVGSGLLLELDHDDVDNAHFGVGWKELRGAIIAEREGFQEDKQSEKNCCSDETKCFRR